MLDELGNIDRHAAFIVSTAKHLPDAVRSAAVSIATEAKHCREQAEKQANDTIDNMRDFIDTYVQVGVDYAHISDPVRKYGEKTVRTIIGHFLEQYSNNVNN